MNLYSDLLKYFDITLLGNVWYVQKKVDQYGGPVIGEFGTEEEALDFAATQFRELMFNLLANC